MMLEASPAIVRSIIVSTTAKAALMTLKSQLRQSPSAAAVRQITSICRHRPTIILILILPTVATPLREAGTQLTYSPAAMALIIFSAVLGTIQSMAVAIMMKLMAVQAVTRSTAALVTIPLLEVLAATSLREALETTPSNT